MCETSLITNADEFFNKLRRTPFEEMRVLFREADGNLHEIRLKSHGWTYKEFIAQLSDTYRKR
jgi:hypothetical protein